VTRKCERLAEGSTAATVIVFVKTSNCRQQEVTANKGQNVCGKVCIQQENWLIARGRGIMHHDCRIHIVPKVLTPETSSFNIACGNQLVAS
jgi:hypothetical protein